MEAAASAQAVNVNVGVMGHVDSGKTHLVRVLSTQLSTAALDKHPQSQQRGMTLDLGFSSFRLPSSSSGLRSVSGVGTPLGNPEIQITLVDCPGHASLFKTILGGVHIIDAVLLVVDISKGLQPQTVECLLLAELAVGASIVVALNKIDLVPEHHRILKIQQVELEIRTFFQQHFVQCQSIAIVPVAAAPGSQDDQSASSPQPPALGISALVAAIQATVTVPVRDASGPLCYAIDHCFSIQGNGTILTGTVLSGCVQSGDAIQLPRLQVTKKVHSMQMFRRSVTRAVQGDRVALRVNGLDASLVERGLAISPGCLPFVDTVIIPVTQVALFQASCRSAAKCHVSIGHTTVVAVATFFQSANPEPLDPVTFNVDEIYRTVQEIQSVTSLDGVTFRGFALLQLEQPVIIPPRTHVVCSRLDLDPKRHHCRLAFHGQIQAVVADEALGYGGYDPVYPRIPLHALRIGSVKERTGTVDKVLSHKSEVLASGMFAKDVDWTVYSGCSVLLTESKCIGRILGPFGKSGKFRIEIVHPGALPVIGEKVLLRFIKLASLRPLKAKDKAPAQARKLLQDDRVLYPEAVVTLSVPQSPVTSPRDSDSLLLSTLTVRASGLVERLKGETTADGRNPFIIATGLFTDEAAAASSAGQRVQCLLSNGTVEEGVVDKPFGKAGKVHVVFPASGGTLASIGDRVELIE